MRRHRQDVPGRTNTTARLGGRLLTLIVALVAAAVVLPAPADAAEEAEAVDVLVYGGTPAGIAAARSAAGEGRRVVIVEPMRWIGGMVTNGLSHPDFRTLEGVTGLYRKLIDRALAYYEEKYGEDSPEVETSYYGTHAEPHVNLMIYEAFLDEAGGVEVIARHRLTSVVTEAAGDGTRIVSARFAGPDGGARTFTAEVFIDATYEGDLLAEAGVAYRVGREAQSEYGESLAPEEADGHVQGYNFRLVLTDDPANRVMPSRPAGYDREEYVDLLPFLESGELESVFCRWSGCIYKRHEPALPNRKFDINDVSNSPVVRLSMPEINDAWPDGDWETRQAIFDKHVRHNVGMLYFLQHDEAVPEKFREEARAYGLPADEFIESGHLPEQLYVREARRMVGRYVFTQADTAYAGADEARTIFHDDAIAMGDYGLNCHGTTRIGPRFGGRHVGEFYRAVPPYHVPYGAIVPKEHVNLLAPGAVSSSHVGFSALRFEPVWTGLGEAAGTAAAVAIEAGAAVQEADVAEVQRRLHADGAATIYVSDVLPGDPDFAAVQWWGMRGGLHGVAERPESGPRGPRLDSQYHAAYPGHAAELDAPLTAELRTAWLAIAESLDLPTGELETAETRGAFIRAAFEMYEERR